MKHVRFAFGRQGISVEVPAGPCYELVESRAAAALPEPEAALEHALDHPIAGLPLRQLSQGRTSAAIAVCDITRPAPNSTTLPPLLRRLHDAGIPPEETTIHIATGLHRSATEDEIRAIVGAEIASTYRILNHDARASAEHRSLGATRRGTPVHIDERFLAADLHITLGFIEQHLMLGFSGGRKLVAPGLAGEQTIKTIHSPRFMRDPLATEGSYDRNPLHAELLEIAAMAGHHFILDVTLTHDRQISGIFAGSPPEAHRAGVAFLEQTSLQILPEPVDLVISSSAGHPLDLTFYQAIKAVTAAQHLVKPGGTILILAECREGVGSPEFARSLSAFSGCREYLDGIEHGPIAVDQWQLEKLSLVGLTHTLLFYAPGVQPSQLGAFGSQLCASHSEAIARSCKGLGATARVALIPEGPYAFARVAA